MIVLQQGLTNSFDLTLSQALTGPTGLTGQNYLMVFDSLYSPGNLQPVFPTVITSNSRYTTFGLDCTEGSPDPLAGQINFYPYGSYRYTLYILDVLSLTGATFSTVLVDDAKIYSCGGPTNLYNFIYGP